MFLQGLKRILTAGGLESAGRTQDWTQQQPIGFDQQDEQGLNRTHFQCFPALSTRCVKGINSARTA
jgi:hypothetical protein